MKAINTYFLDVVKNHYCDFTGRASRQQYWMYILFVFITFFVAALVFSFLGKVGTALYYLTVTALILPNFGITVRRLHDTNRSGWWFLLNFVPIANIVLLVFLFLPTVDAGNRFNK